MFFIELYSAAKIIKMCKNCAFDFIVGADARVCPSKRPCLPASMPSASLETNSPADYFTTNFRPFWM